MKNENGISAIAVIIIVVLIVIVVFVFMNLNTETEKVENEVAGYTNSTFEDIIELDENSNVQTIEIDTSDIFNEETVIKEGADEPVELIKEN